MLDSAALDSLLQDRCLLDKRRAIVVGVSGGPDSLCLLALLHEAGWPVVAAHFNHQLRAVAAEDAEAVKQIAAHMGVAYVADSADVGRHAADNKLSIEAAARDLRYRFLFEQAQRHGAQAVAVGHTADDQVETVLMHFIRGAGLSGLKGMEYRTLLPQYQPGHDKKQHILLVRPLLDAWRAETVAYCQSHGLPARYDASNDSLDFLRNRVRHELIPLLESYNPRVREAVWRAARTLQLDDEIVRGAVEPLFNQALLRAGGRYIHLDAGSLNELDDAGRAHVVRTALHALLPDYDLGYNDIQRALAFLGDSSQERSDFVGGLVLLREPGAIYLSFDRDVPSDAWPQLPEGQDALRIAPPCVVPLAAGWGLAANEGELVEGAHSTPGEGFDTREAFLDADTLPAELELRVRRPGDRFEPLGMDGHSQKLSDFFINAKLPARARDRWPLVCAGERIAWVPGFRPAEFARVTDTTRRILHLSIWHPVRES